MPEPDGVESGVPFEADNNFQDASAINRTSDNRQSPDDSGILKRKKNSSSNHKGLSLRIKLNFGVGLLIAVIVVIGYVSLSALNTVNSISEVVANDQAQLAKVTEEIKATVYKMRDAEKDFMLLEEQESLDRVTRFTSRVRSQLDKANEIGQRIADRTDAKVSDLFVTMHDRVDDYESRFASQVKSIKNARHLLDEEDAANLKNKANLASEIETGIESVRQLTTDYWLDKAADVDPQLMRVGLELEQISRDMLEIQIMIANYFGSGKQRFADNARTRIAEILALTDQLRSASDDAAIRQGMAELRKTMQLYSAMIKESSDRIAQADNQRELVDSQNTQQKDGLRQVGAGVIDMAESLSKSSWNEIADESFKLTHTSDAAQWQLSVVVAIGIVAGTAYSARQCAIINGNQ